MLFCIFCMIYNFTIAVTKFTLHFAQYKAIITLQIKTSLNFWFHYEVNLFIMGIPSKCHVEPKTMSYKSNILERLELKFESVVLLLVL